MTRWAPLLVCLVACGGEKLQAAASDAGSGGSDAIAPMDASVPDAVVVGADSGQGRDTSTAGCPGMEIMCGAACVDLGSDVANCGACGAACSGTCMSGHCTVTLAEGMTGASAIALDDTSVYWTVQNAGAGLLAKVPKAGGPTVTLASQLEATGGLAVDATNVYWTEAAVCDSGRVLALVRSDLEGGNVVTISTQAGKAVALDDTNVYWTSTVGGQDGGVPQGAIMGVAKSGGTPAVLATRSAPFVDHLTAQGSTLYFNENDLTQQTSHIVALPPGGAPAQMLASWPLVVQGLASDGVNVYWAAQQSDVVSVPVTGGIPAVLAGGFANPHGIAVDATGVYVAVQGQGGQGNGSLVRIPTTGGAATILALSSSPVAVALDATRAYWLESSGAVFATTK